MRAVVQRSVGGPEVLELVDVPRPEPAAGEVLVRVRAAGVNPADLAVRAGYFPLLGEPPFTVGWDISGIVEATGPGVNAYSVGDAVFGMPRFPGQAAAYAEYVAAPADELADKPAELNHLQAGALPLAGLTAWQGLIGAGKLQAGQKVLIHAGAGGVGHLAVQIAKAQGAHVTATASSGKLDFVRSLGADEVIDYQADDFTARGEAFDLVLEPIGGQHTERSVAVVKPGGVLVALLNPSDAACSAAAAKDVRIERISVAPDSEGLASLAKLAEAGRLRVHVAKAFPLADVGAAHQFLAETRPAGKVVLEI